MDCCLYQHEFYSNWRTFANDPEISDPSNNFWEPSTPSNGEMKTKFQRKQKMSWDCGGGDIATNSSIKKIYKTVELAEKPDLDLD